MVLVSVYDKASELWEPPMAYETVALAQRALRATFRGKFGDMEPELMNDLEFWIVGDFDRNAGKVVSGDFKTVGKRIFIDNEKKQLDLN